MSSQIYFSSKDQEKWQGMLKCGDIDECPFPNESHFAIIAKGNIIEGIEAMK